MLNQHPEVEFHDEPFTKLLSQGSDQQFAALSRQLLTEVEGVTCIGVATKLRSLIDEDRLRWWILNNNVQTVYMTRRNTVKLVISEVRGLQLNKEKKAYNARSSNEVLGPKDIDPQLFHHYFVQRLGFEARLGNFVNTLRTHSPILEIHYEDLLDDENYVMSLLFSSFGVEPTFRAPSEIHKNTSDSLRESVSNLDELINLYRGTRFESMFSE